MATFLVAGGPRVAVSSFGSESSAPPKAPEAMSQEELIAEVRRLRSACPPLPTLTHDRLHEIINGRKRM